MPEIEKFITGFKRFQGNYFGENRDLFEHLKLGQHPRAAVVACCDSRVDPAILTGSEPGDIFVVRNVANLVPRGSMAEVIMASAPRWSFP